MLRGVKFIKKKRIALVLMLSMTLQLSLSESIFADTVKINNQNYKQDLIDEQIPGEITDYVNVCYEDLVETCCIYDENVDINNPDNCDLGEPFIIYDLDGDMKAVYYYPVIENGEVVLLVSAISTTDGIALSASREMVSRLNEIDYVENGDLIFYESDDEINAMGTTKKYKINYGGKIKNKDLQEFESQGYTDCIEEISKNISEMETIDVEQDFEENSTDEILEMYTPTFSVNNVTGTKGGRTCKLYNAQGQGSYNNCWAASVATIVNYLKGTNYTAKQVCNKMGIGYNTGASISDKQKALKAYGYTYKKTSSQLGFGVVRANIDSKRPIAMSCVSTTNDGHATTLYGYNVTASGSYIVMHNSGGNNSVTLLYKNTGTTFTYAGKTWTWTASLSYK